LGGVDGHTDQERRVKDGLYSFKKDFGGTVVSQPGGFKTISLFGARINSILTVCKRMVTR